MLGFERRKSKRIKPHFTLRSQVTSRQKGICHEYFLEILDLSEGGLCLRSPEEFPLGTELQLSLPGQNSHLPYRVKGKVVWSQKNSQYSFHCGIEFMPDAAGEYNEKGIKELIAYYTVPFSVPSRN